MSKIDIYVFFLEAQRAYGKINNCLSRKKLSDYLTIKFGSPVQGAQELGGIDKAIESYIGFQAHLY